MVGEGLILEGNSDKMTCFEGDSEGVSYLYLSDYSRVSHLTALLKIGSRNDPEEAAGMTHYIEHMLFKGTQSRDYLEITSSLDKVGGELNAFTEKEFLCVHAVFPDEYLELAVDIFDDLLHNSTFPKREVQKEKDVILDEINSYLDNPAEQILDDIETLVFNSHPLGTPILGTKKSLKNIKQKELIEYYEGVFKKNPLVVGYSGIRTKENWMRLLEGKFNRTNTQNPGKSFPPNDFEANVFRKKKNTFQLHKVFAFKSPSVHEEDRYAMALLVNYLGGPAMNSRLNVLLREMHGLSYQVEANYFSFSDAGLTSIYYASDKKNEKKCDALIFDEIKRLLDEPLSNTTLQEMKIQVKGQLLISSESRLGELINASKQILLLNKLETRNALYEKIENLTPQDLLCAARKYLNREDWTILTYGK